MEFNFNSKTEQPNLVIFSFSGRINKPDITDPALVQLTDYLDNNKNLILFDLSKLEYINSSGLNFFIRTLTRVRNVGGELILCGVNGDVEKLFLISKLNEIFTICSSVEEGIAQINAKKA